MRSCFVSGRVVRSLPSATFGQAASWVDFGGKIRPAVVVAETDKRLGCGFFVKADGTSVTNHHIIAGATAVNVKLSNGEIFRRVYLLADSGDRDL